MTGLGKAEWSSYDLPEHNGLIGAAGWLDFAFKCIQSDAVNVTPRESCFGISMRRGPGGIILHLNAGLPDN